MSQSVRRGFVLGGGVAGLGAAFGLVDRGYRVTVIEPRKELGGRVFSFDDPHLGRLDNGPHVMLGCYRDMRALLRRLGTEGEFAQPGRLVVSYRTEGTSGPSGELQEPRSARLALPRGLPTPLGMPLGLAKLPLGPGGRRRAMRGLLASVREPRAEMSIAAWCALHGQQGAPADWFWTPLCRAVMNAAPADVSARLFLATLREAFSGRASRAAVWLARRPWGALVGEAARDVFAATGVEVRHGARVAAIECDREHQRVVGLVVGEERVPVGPDDLVVSAVPERAFRRWLETDSESNDPHGQQGLHAAPPMASSPIVSVYFELKSVSSEFLTQRDGDLINLVGGSPFHFLCRTPGEPFTRFALLSGGDRSLDGCSVAAIEQFAREQLHRCWPAFEVDTAATVRVVKEAHATFVAAPDWADRQAPGMARLGTAQPLQNLAVCGDWTNTGLPATLEGAARSARLMLAALDRDRTV